MAKSSGNSLADLASFLIRLENARIHHTLTSVRDGAVMVQVAVPGERWEIEFFPDQPIEIEVFLTEGEVGGPILLDRLFRENEEPSGR